MSDGKHRGTGTTQVEIESIKAEKELAAKKIEIEDRDRERDDRRATVKIVLDAAPKLLAGFAVLSVVVLAGFAIAWGSGVSFSLAALGLDFSTTSPAGTIPTAPETP